MPNCHTASVTGSLLLEGHPAFPAPDWPQIVPLHEAVGGDAMTLWHHHHLLLGAMHPARRHQLWAPLILEWQGHAAGEMLTPWGPAKKKKGPCCS